MYYIDVFAEKIVEEKDPYAAPERYVEYIKGLTNVIIETYAVSYNPLAKIDFAYSINEDRDILNIKRNIFFRINNLPDNLVLISYTVPPEWYEAEVAKIKSSV